MNFSRGIYSVSAIFISFAVLIFGFSGCGSGGNPLNEGGDSESSSPEPASDTTPPTFTSSINVAAWDGEGDRSRSAIWVAAVDAGSGISHYEISVVTDSGDSTCNANDIGGVPLAFIRVPAAADFSGVGYQVIHGNLDGNLQTINLTLTGATDYCTIVRAVDVAGNTTDAFSSIYQQPFRPNHLGSLELWLDANDSATLFQDTGCSTAVTTTGQNVNCWQDKSGNSRHATNNSHSPPVYSSVGSNKVDFSGGSKYLDGTAPIVGNGARSVFFLAKFDALGSGANQNAVITVAPNTVSSGQGWAFCVEQSTGSTGIGVRVSGNKMMDHTVDTVTPAIISAQNGSAENVTDINFFQNGIQLVTVNTQTGATLNTNSIGYILGGFPTDSTTVPTSTIYDFEGNSREILVYSSDIGSADREKIEGYLACKWSQQGVLSGGHPYKTTCP